MGGVSFRFPRQTGRFRNPERCLTADGCAQRRHATVEARWNGAVIASSADIFVVVGNHYPDGLGRCGGAAVKQDSHFMAEVESTGHARCIYWLITSSKVAQ